MTVPKCTSWSGHKFEARFDKEPPADIGEIRGSTTAIALMLDGMSKQTYVHDICVRCGHIVKRGQS